MREAQLRCSPSEFTEWKAFYKLDPWGQERADMRTGMLCAMVGNALRRKGARRLKASDFYLSDRRGVRKQSPQQMFNVLTELMSMQQAAPRG